MRDLKPFRDVVSHHESTTTTMPMQATLSAKDSKIAQQQTDYGYLFPELQGDPENFLPVSPQTVADLQRLAGTMRGPGTPGSLDSVIPSAYSYFGQFVGHDLTLMKSSPVNFGDPNLHPLTAEEIANIRNLRTPTLDLDSVYGEAPQVNDDFMLVGAVAHSGNRPPGKFGDDFDLPRTGRLGEVCKDPLHDRAARVGDRRNDETTTLGQLHVVFLRAHNAIVEAGYNYCEARSLLRQYYQLVVAHDFLKRVADPAIVDGMLAKPWPRYEQSRNGTFIPLEFSNAVYRFGHSMIRSAYDFNVNFPPALAPLRRLFDVLGRYPTMPESWIIEWERFVDGGTNKARKIDTQLAGPLFTLPGMHGVSVATLTLLRGYLLRLPTGQAVARALGVTAMTAGEIEAVAANANADQLKAVKASGFSSRTPLWFYTLAEAAHFQQGQRLGPVGSTVVAGVLISLIRRSKDSFMSIPGWSATAPDERQTFSLPGLSRVADVFRPDFVFAEGPILAATAASGKL